MIYRFSDSTFQNVDGRLSNLDIPGIMIPELVFHFRL